MRIPRTEILQRLRERIEAGVPIIGGGAGTGISAKCEEAGGIDLIVIYNSGRFRMAGRGSLAGLMPYGDANAIVMEMAREVLTVVGHTPVLAGVCGTDPFRDMQHFLRQVADVGFSGVQNFPTVGLIDGQLRVNLEETGMGYDREVEMIRLAHRLDLLTTPYAFTPQEAEQMADAGADIVVAHMGLTTRGSIGARTARTLQECERSSADRRRRPRRSVRGDRTVPWRTDRDAGRRSLRPATNAPCAWLLRRVFHGTVAGRTGHHRAGTQVQSDCDGQSLKCSRFRG